MVQGIIVPASDAEDLRAVEVAEIEALEVLSFGCTMFLNEEGLIPGLPYNRPATYLWWHHVPHARGQARLAGDGVLVGLLSNDRETTNVPGELANYCSARRSARSSCSD